MTFAIALLVHQCDPTYVPGGTVIDKISGFYGVQPGEYLEYLPDEDGD